jgi:hypothetical protein
MHNLLILFTSTASHVRFASVLSHARQRGTIYVVICSFRDEFFANGNDATESGEDLGNIGCVVLTNVGVGALADWEVHKVRCETLSWAGRTALQSHPMGCVVDNLMHCKCLFPFDLSPLVCGQVVIEKIVEGGLENGTFWRQWVIPCYGWVPAEGRRHFFEAQPRLPRHVMPSLPQTFFMIETKCTIWLPTFSQSKLVVFPAKRARSVLL